MDPLRPQLPNAEQGKARTQPARIARSAVQVALGLLFSAACLYLALRGVQLGSLASTLGRARPLPLLAAVAVEILTFLAIAARWQRLFTPHPAPSPGRLFEILNVAQLANAVLPGKVGPLVRAYLAGQGTAGGVAFALTTIVGEKVVEGMSLLLIALAILPFIPSSLESAQLPWTVWLGAVLLLLALGIMVFLARRQQAVISRLERVLRRWPRLLDFVRSALSALDVWRRGRVVLALWIWSIAIWAITVLLNQLILWSLSIRVPAVAPVVVLVVSQVGLRLPSSPGSIGVLHYLSILALSLFGVDKSVALGFGIILHLVIYLPASLLGLLFLARSGYSLKRLQQASTETEVSG
jgi:glycosyltransferase 2 family protein